MEEQERWLQIPEHPGYEVSNFGRVCKVGATRPMSVSFNNHGHGKLSMLDETHARRTRSVALMVASAFVPQPDASCTQVINLNGNPQDLRACNLAWRPEGFAWKYTHQFKVHQPIHMYNLPIINVVYDLSYANVVEAAANEGLLFGDIWRSTYTGEELWPNGSSFRVPR